MSAAVQLDIDRLLDTVADEVPGVVHAVVVSPDGLLLSSSRDISPGQAERLAAITAGLVSLTGGAAGVLASGTVRQNICEMDAGFLFTVSTSEGAALTALASRGCDVGELGYRLAQLAERVGAAAEPATGQATGGGR